MNLWRNVLKFVSGVATFNVQHARSNLQRLQSQQRRQRKCNRYQYDVAHQRFYLSFAGCILIQSHIDFIHPWMLP